MARLKKSRYSKPTWDYDLTKEVIGASYYELSRRDFWTFRRLVHPRLIEGWWQEDAANHLNDFWTRYKRGERPKLVLGAPPQHGKSDMMKDFSAWTLGMEPNAKVIFASYSDDLGVSANLHLQRLLPTPAYRAVFPGTMLPEAGAMTENARPRRTTSYFELANSAGSFRNTTVNGMITGFGLDLGIIDDPIKGRAEAQSTQIRNKTWSWLTDDFFLRFADHAAMVMIMTRWHVDDPVGRWLERFPDTKLINYTAIAEVDETIDLGNRIIQRKVDDVLFPEFKSREFLMERKAALTDSSWQSLYQQHPIVVGGGIFPIEKIRTRPFWAREMSKKVVRYWDKAGTEGGEGARTAGVLMHTTADGEYVISDVVKGRWGSLEREAEMLSCARRDQEIYGSGYEVAVEQEPGSGGKESAETTVRNLRGFRVYLDKPGANRSKEVRAEPFAAQVQGGNVSVVAGTYVRELFEELEHFPNGRYKDQVDAASGAFNRLTLGHTYNIDNLI